MRYLLIFIFITVSAWAQEDDSTTDQASNRQFWEANLKGGNYMVKLGSVSAISNHAYVLDGSLVVTEVNIDTPGSALVRFYQVTPLAAYKQSEITNLLSEGVSTIKDLTSNLNISEAASLAQKQYPQTTHAKTIEFQIDTLEQLSSLYKSISKSWTTNKGRKFSIK